MAPFFGSWPWVLATAVLVGQLWAQTAQADERAGRSSHGQAVSKPGASDHPEPAIAAHPEVLQKAQKHFRQGVAFAKAGNCDGAIVEFTAAYRLIPRPNALYNIGQCQERLFRYDLAIEYYERYLREAAEDAPDRAAVRAALRTLGNLLGVLHVAANVAAEVWVDDRLMGEAPGDVFVPAGRHMVELRAKGYIPARTEVQLVGREEVDIRLKLIKARTTVRVRETTGLSPLVFWSGVGLTAVSAAVGGLFALQVLSLKEEAEEINKYHPDRVQAQKDVQSAELTADIFFATAGVLAIATTVLAFVTDWEQEQKPEPVSKPSAASTPRAGSSLRERRGALRLDAGLTPQCASLGLQGVFL